MFIACVCIPIYCYLSAFDTQNQTGTKQDIIVMIIIIIVMIMLMIMLIIIMINISHLLINGDINRLSATWCSVVVRRFHFVPVWRQLGFYLVAEYMLS